MSDAKEVLEKAREILFAYGDENEITAHPWWAVVKKGSFGRYIVMEGPFFSRERAEELLDAYGENASVYCFSGERSQHYKDLREVLKSEVANESITAESLVAAFVQGANFAWPHGSQTAEEEALKRLANGTLGKKGGSDE